MLLELSYVECEDDKICLVKALVSVLYDSLIYHQQNPPNLECILAQVELIYSLLNTEAK